MADGDEGALSMETWRSTLLAAAAQAADHFERQRREAPPPPGPLPVVAAVYAGPAPDGAAGSTVWPQHAWQVALEVVFCAAPAQAAALCLHDDLLYLVRSAAAGPADGKDGGAAPPLLFARRRRGARLPADLGVGAAGADGVDWRASFAANLALHCGYTLATARRGALDAAGGGAADARAVEVTRAVHASPTRAPVGLGAGREARAAGGGSFFGGGAAADACFPDLSFSVDDYAAAFQDVVLERAGDAYAVRLLAGAGASWGAAAGLAPAGGGGAGAAEVFSGYVALEQLPAPPRRRLSGGGGAGEPQHVRMVGPGGRGSADVAVCVPPEAAAGAAAAGSPGGGGGGLGALRRAVARGLGALRPEGGPPAPPARRCALMSLLVPVDACAEGICAALQAGAAAAGAAAAPAEAAAKGRGGASPAAHV